MDATGSNANDKDLETSNLPRDMISSFRTGTTKSRNGCIVCKIRRVKCDETKPHCIRCTSTGRTCEGYGEAPKRNKSKSPARSKSPPKEALVPIIRPKLVYSPSTDVQASPEERRSFHYFRSRNMSEMPGNFEPYFWDHMVLQFSHRYPTILQALVALSAIYEENDRQFQDPMTVTSEGYALQQYNKAVKDLMQYLASDNQDPRVALTTCLIFVWIEFLQDNLSSGFQHLNCGLKILRDLRFGIESRVQDRDAEDILGSLDRSFTRLRIQAALHGAQDSLFTTSCTRELEVLEPIPTSFLNVFESRNVLDKELNAIFGYVRKLRETGYYSNIDIDMFMEIQKGHLERLEQWQVATMKLAAELEVNQDRSQTSGILYLQLYHIVVSVVWKTMFAGSEMVFDDYTAEFEATLAIASSLMNNPKSTTAPVLSFDMGIIPPLFWLSLKCRVLKFRKKAIALLKKAPKREGMWHRDSIITYCEWKIMMEEQWRGGVSEEEPLPEYARIYGEHLSDKSECSILGESRQPLFVSFKRGPAGLDIQDTAEIPGASDILRLMGNLI